MIVGFLINTCEPFYRGGYEQRAWTFARELARQGHEVRIYTSCPRDEVIEGVRFIRLAPLRLFFNQHGVRNGWADFLFSLSVLTLLGRKDFRELDVLDICATPFLHLFPAAFVAWVKRIPAVLTCHEALLGSLPEYAQERGNDNAVAREAATLVMAAIYRVGMGLFPQRLAVSHRTARALEEEGYPAQAVVEFGLDSAAFASRPPESLPEAEPVRFIFCGRLAPNKCVDHALRAFIPLCSESKPFHFDIVGEGSERAELERIAGKTDKKDMVTFQGEVSEEAKRALLARSEIFVLSSPREGFSIATLEAMAQGCAAVVVSDPQKPNGVLDFVHDGEQGLCVSPGLPSLTEALQKLLRDFRLRLMLRRGAWQAAQAYKIETQVRRLVDFYQKIIFTLSA